MGGGYECARSMIFCTCNPARPRKSRVINVAHVEGNMRRVRECPRCARRWTTIELEDTEQALEERFKQHHRRSTGRRAHPDGRRADQRG